MNTPTHMLIAAAVFARPIVPATLIAAFLGGFVPDLPMFSMVLWSTRVVGVPEQEVFGQLFFSDRWQAVFAIDHSFVLWGLFLALGFWQRNLPFQAFAGAGLLHAVTDFLTHHDDARRQLWPLSDWVFRSPVSYWDARYFGDIFVVFEVGLVVVLSVVLYWRLQTLWQRLLVLAIAAPIVIPMLLTGSLHALHGMG